MLYFMLGLVLFAVFLLVLRMAGLLGWFVWGTLGVIVLLVAIESSDNRVTKEAQVTDQKVSEMNERIARQKAERAAVLHTDMCPQPFVRRGMVDVCQTKRAGFDTYATPFSRVGYPADWNISPLNESEAYQGIILSPRSDASVKVAVRVQDGLHARDRWGSPLPMWGDCTLEAPFYAGVNDIKQRGGEIIEAKQYRTTRQGFIDSHNEPVYLTDYPMTNPYAFVIVWRHGDQAGYHMAKTVDAAQSCTGVSIDATFSAKRLADVVPMLDSMTREVAIKNDYSWH